MSFDSVILSDPSSAGNLGWVTVETTLIQLNTAYTPAGRFPVYSNESLPDANGAETRIGYDAAVCVRKYEPWIIEAYGTSIISPSTLRIVDKGNNSTPVSPSGIIQGAQIANTRHLNTTGKDAPFSMAHSNSINQMFDDDDLGTDYTLTPTVGPVVPPRTNFLPTSIYFHRSFPSPKAGLGNTPNFPQTGLPLPLHGSVQLAPCHTLWGRGPSSHNCMRMRRWHTPLTIGGN